MKTVLNMNTALAFTRRLCYRFGLACVLAFLVFPLAASAGFNPVLAQPEPGTIAYVKPDDAAGDEIRLIEPDGSNDRLLWKTGVPGVEGLGQISALAWHPASSGLAFASRHEEACSLYNSDIYTIHSDGSGYRRVTAGPACGQATGQPTGTVKLTVENWTEENGPFIVYFQGAPKPQSITLAPGGATTVTFTNVADYGNFKQWGVAVFGQYRFISIEANADVLAGKTVNGGTVSMYSSYTEWGWYWPSWKSDGSQTSYAFGYGTPYMISADDSRPGIIGAKLFNVNDSQFPFDPAFLAWAPAGPRANQLLYIGSDDSYNAGVYLADAGSSSAGSILLYIDPDHMGNYPLGLVWLPDSSGFLYSKTEGFGETANIYEYSFATHASTRITDFTSGYPRRLSVSPDGGRIIYEYQASGEWYDHNPDLDLWIMNRDGSGQTLFVQNGRAPAWSPTAISDFPVPTLGDKKLFLPLIVKP